MLYFGMLKDAMGSDGETMSLPDGATVELLLARHRLAETPVWRSLAVAVNREYAGRETRLHEGDEVALLPPVSGGAWVSTRPDDAAWNREDGGLR